MMHATVASMLRFFLSAGAFNLLDAFVSSIERVWHGKEGCKQRKKKLRRKARKVSCSLRLLLCIIALMQTCALSCGAPNDGCTRFTSTQVVVQALY